MFGAISEKFRTADMQINFSLSSVVGGILFPFSINSSGKSKTS